MANWSDFHFTQLSEFCKFAMVTVKKSLINLVMQPAQLQTLIDPVVIQSKVALKVLRLDTMHEQISGNKWFKLKHNLQLARQQGHELLLSFGGAYSNHIHALAAAGAYFGFKTIGLIRGEIDDPENKTLKFARQQGMELVAVSRSDYRNKGEKVFLDQLTEKYGDFYLIPEGGSNCLAVTGCAEIVPLLHWQVEAAEHRFVILPCGTGSTLAGIVKGSEGSFQVIGIAVLKGAGFLYTDISNLLVACGVTNAANWTLVLNYHFGGYARYNNELLSFMDAFTERTAIPLEPIYTAKMFFALYQLLEQDVFPQDSEIIVLHTGGLQGWQSKLP